MYGVYLSIHPSVSNKYVMIHRDSCPYFKQHKDRKNMYTFNKKAKNLRKAIERASEDSLEWHAPIYMSEMLPQKGKDRMLILVVGTKFESIKKE
jgi:hypothetical protein